MILLGSVQQFGLSVLLVDEVHVVHVAKCAECGAKFEKAGNLCVS